MSSSLPIALLSLSLVAAAVLTFQFPLHIRSTMKLHMNSVPLFLMAALLPPPLATTTAGVGVLVGELSSRTGREADLSSVAKQVGRWMLVVLAGSAVAQLPMSSSMPRGIAIALAGGVLWAGDLLTGPILLSLSGGEPAARAVRAALRDARVTKGVEYLIGLASALVVAHEVWALALLFLPTTLVHLAFRKVRGVREGTRQVLESMADTVDLRDAYTGGHSHRVAELTVRLVCELGIAGTEAELIVAAARVHDIGKIGVPDYVLKKEGPLTSEERAVMEAHAELGAELLQRYPDFARGVEIVRHHHETWDGNGYPHRLRGEQIPLGARIVAVADAFDAMTSNRPYRPAISAERACAILLAGRGRQWDPAIVDAFLQSIAARAARPVAPIPHLLPRTSEQYGIAALQPQGG